MNGWGVDGCRQHRVEIIDRLSRARKEAGWLATLFAAKSTIGQPWFSIGDPLGSLVDEAIRRAEDRERHYTLSDLSIIVSSFLRSDCLRRLLISIRYYYPGIQVIVADQSADTPDSNLQNQPHVQWLRLPFDCGLSVSRNAAVRAANTRLVMVCDDDEVFTDETRLERLVDVLNHDQSVDLVSGLIRPSGETEAEGWQADLVKNGESLQANPTQRPWQRTAAGTLYQRTDRYLNVFVARRELLLRYAWIERYKIGGEHLDHVLQLWKGGVGVAYTPECVIGEMPTNDSRYAAFRRRSSGEVTKSWGFKAKQGEWSAQRLPMLGSRVTQAPVAVRQSIVMLTVGHTGSSVTAGLLSQLGWFIPDCDHEFNEPASLRAANDALRKGENVDLQHIVSSLQPPWLLKDPRFCETLDAWIPHFAKHKPLLLWLQRDEEAVRESWTRRGQPLQRLLARQEAAQRHFSHWPWAKQVVDFERLKDWAMTVR